jgi:hypothetical protein
MDREITGALLHDRSVADGHVQVDCDAAVIAGLLGIAQHRTHPRPSRSPPMANPHRPGDAAGSEQRRQRYHRAGQDAAERLIVCAAVVG